MWKVEIVRVYKSSNLLYEHEDKVIFEVILACLKGLKEQGCNGPVTEAIDKIQKHINKQAHDQED